MIADDDGYRLWLRYEPIADPNRRAQYTEALRCVVVEPGSPTLQAARSELARGLRGLLGNDVVFERAPRANALVVGTPFSSPVIAALGLDRALEPLGREGFVIRRVQVDGHACVVIAANEDVGALYGTFRWLRHLQTHGAIDAVDLADRPKLTHRMLDHWDNLDGTIERGYAGFSIWDWHKLPDYVSPQYEDYARADASVGINGVVLTNVNADSLVLTREYLEKVAALAGVFRPYGMRVYLTARFSAPIEIGALSTADPLDANVVRFWRDKTAEMYRHIPDFGGFVVKANSEGQPGPGDYGRTHADGANLLADALAPHGGVVLWRAFVYANREGEDRAKQAFLELAPLDGQFRENVALQVKNGPIDFQPREPFHPLFGAMPKTPLVAEFQLTQEYLGFATHLAYLGTLFQETLDSETGAPGEGSSVASVIGRRLPGCPISGMAAVANIGTDRNWCGHPFAQSNWYAFGRLAWDPAERADRIAEDWIRMTFTNDAKFVEPVLAMTLGSREAVVDYMTPLGLHHLMAADHHYGPAPWDDQGRADWTPVYFHRADAEGLGFDRTRSGSDAVSLYASPVGAEFGSLERCPEKFLLWFHHVAWDRRLGSGRTLWDELCQRYQSGVDAVRTMARTWASLEGSIDERRHAHVGTLLQIQEKEARWWQGACLLYFQTFSRLPLPPGCEAPTQTLDEFMRIRHHHVPGI